MKKLVGTAVAVAVLVLGATGALAGEVTGAAGDGNDKTPDYTPISPLSDDPVHASACAFSGLEDGWTLVDEVPTEVDDSGPGYTQTPHYEAGTVFEPGVPAFSPFYNCVGQAPGRTVPGHGPQG